MLEDKVKASIERLKAFEPTEGYYLAFSGGKDSVVCKALLDMAGVKYDATYRVTSVDPPELVRFIKEKHPDVIREIPRYPRDYKNEKLAGKPITMWNLIPEKLLPPHRMSRYCCEYLKESGGDGRLTVTGVRWAESPNRRNNQGIVTIYGAYKGEDKEQAAEVFQKPARGRGYVLVNDNDDSRRMVESCIKRNKTTLNPIIDWSDEDVWGFIKSNNVPYCRLYDEGFNRLGCIGCPLIGQKKRIRDFARWPKYKDAYMRAFVKMLEEREKRGKPFVANGQIIHGMTAEDVFNWWMRNDVLPGQINLFEMEE